MNVVIGCKLPHGVTLSGFNGEDITINGMNTSLVAGGFGITNVDEAQAAFLFAHYADFGPFKNNAIFSLGDESVADLAALAHELRDEKTGFEGLNPDKPAENLKPENEAALDKQKEQAEAKPRPAKAPKTAADKAAAKALAGKA